MSRPCLDHNRTLPRRPAAHSRTAAQPHSRTAAQPHSRTAWGSLKHTMLPPLACTDAMWPRLMPRRRCVICQDDYCAGETLHVLGCGHYFHEACRERPPAPCPSAAVIPMTIGRFTTIPLAAGHRCLARSDGSLRGHVLIPPTLAVAIGLTLIQTLTLSLARSEDTC